jgi:hypothetical protein
LVNHPTPAVEQTAAVFNRSRNIAAGVFKVEVSRGIEGPQSTQERSGLRIEQALIAA